MEAWPSRGFWNLEGLEGLEGREGLEGLKGLGFRVV